MARSWAGRAALVLVLLVAVPLAGCAQPRSVGDCGLRVYMPPRHIDEGTRYDAREVVGPGLALNATRYLFENGTRQVYGGILADLVLGGGNRSLKFLDTNNDSLLDVPDAFVTLDGQGPMRLTLAVGTNIVGGSFGCES